MNEEKLITENLALINMSIKQLNLITKTEDEFQEYYDAGLDGLIKGAKTYNASKGKPSTYLTICIKNSIKHFLMYKTTKGRLNPNGRDLSLDYEINIPGENPVSLIDYIEDPNVNIEENVEKRLDYEFILEAIEHLENENDKFCIKQKYGVIDGICHTGREIAEMMGVSHQNVEQRIKRAVKKTKNYVETQERKKKILGGDMGKNLISLNDYLFEELERLNNKDIIKDDDKLLKEISRSNSISKLAQNIINNANTVLEINKLFNKNQDIPELLGIPKKSDK